MQAGCYTSTRTLSRARPLSKIVHEVTIDAMGCGLLAKGDADVVRQVLVMFSAGTPAADAFLQGAKKKTVNIQTFVSRSCFGRRAPAELRPAMAKARGFGARTGVPPMECDLHWVQFCSSRRLLIVMAVQAISVLR